jgi:hypothetical protein
MAVSSLARFIILLFALGVASEARRRMSGVEGWGRHLRGGARTVAKETHALTHPSNQASPEGLIAVRILDGPPYAATARDAGRTRVGSYRVPSRNRA